MHRSPIQKHLHMYLWLRLNRFFQLRPFYPAISPQHSFHLSFKVDTQNSQKKKKYITSEAIKLIMRSSCRA